MAKNNPLIHPAPVQEVLCLLDAISSTAIETKHWFTLVHSAHVEIPWLSSVPMATVGSVTLCLAFLHYLMPIGHILIKHDGVSTPSSMPFICQHVNDDVINALTKIRNQHTEHIMVQDDNMSAAEDNN